MSKSVEGEHVNMSRIGDTLPAAGSVLLIRDEEWLVTRAERASDGEWFVSVQGISELVRHGGSRRLGAPFEYHSSFR